MSGEEQRTVLVTGAAGFIGGHLCKALLEQNYRVIGLDCMIPYYDLRLKEQHLSEIASHPAAKKSFSMHKFNINDRAQTESLLATHKPTAIVHLAAQAGVRYCEANPEEADYNNTKATRLLLDLIQAPGSSVKQFLFASSSSIYGEHQRPWNETLQPRPVGVYGSSKFRGEQMCQEVAENSQGALSIAAMRFFTVYGPLGRPDMSPAKFLERVFRRQPLPIYGDGSAIRDFTFVGDIVDGIILTLKSPPKGFELYNLGKGTLVPNSVMDLIRQLERLLHKPAILEFEGPQAGDVPATQADITKAQSQIGYQPRYELPEGLEITVRHFLRIVPKHLVVILRISDDSELLCRQLEILNSQTRRPDLVLVLDQSTPVEFQQNEELLKGTPGWEQLSVSHREHSVWRVGVDRVQHLVQQKRFLHASEVFVQFGLDQQTWPADLLSSLETQISENGFEAIRFQAPGANGGGNRDDLLIRLDVLEEVWDRAALNESKDDAFLPSLQETLCYSENVYKNF